MINYIKRAISLVIVLVLAFGVVGALAGCDDGEKDPPPAEDVYYTVAFNVNCDEDVRTPASQNVKAGEKATRPQDPYRAGYRIEGWYTEEACTNLFDFDTPINAHKTLYAKWEDATVRFTVTYEYNGGTGTTTSTSVKDGELVAEPEDPVRAHYFFDGWYRDNTTFEQQYDFSAPVKEDLTLYAKWTKAVTVTYDFNYVGAPASVTKEIPENTAAEPIVPEDRTGFVFSAWYTDAECETMYRNEPVTEDKTLYAGWVSSEAQKYTYTFHYNYTTEPESFTVEVVEGGNAGTVSSPVREGYDFDGWFLDESGTQTFDLFGEADRDRTLYAKWTKVHTVTFSLNYDEKVLTQKKVRDGERVSAPNDPEREHCEFLGWYTEESCETRYVFTASVTQDLTLYAKWEAEQQEYVFEAEYVDLAGQEGAGYSNPAYGTQMIQADYEGAAKASNGYFVGFMCKKGVTLTFNITSDSDVRDARLVLRLSAEMFSTVTIKSNEFSVVVNGKTLSYSDIVIDNINTDVSSRAKREFQDFEVGTKLSLNKGENKIELIVNNDRIMMGTASATAPMVDCIKITTKAILSWDPLTSNIGR